ncbi:MAG: PHP domain-containing protein, partial [Bacilli bacterium]|nr:PHP domain-containing protein [Bacilli bacterium]
MRSLVYSFHMGFTRLHLYTGYSFLKSALTVPKAVGFAKKMGAEFISVCDFGSLSGAPELAKLAPQYGLKPLYGMDALIDGNLFSLFVENENGYRNLLQICLKHSQKSLDLPFLKGHLGGLIVVLDGHNSFLAYADRGKFPEIARTLAAISEGIPCFCLG